jgi:hypothetical protein
MNVMARGLEALGIEARLPRQIRVLSFLPTPSKVKPITPAKKGGVTGGARGALTQLEVTFIILILYPLSV